MKSTILKRIVSQISLIMKNIIFYFGYGKAKINILLEEEAKPGETVEGKFLINGGILPQTFKNLNLYLESNYFVKKFTYNPKTAVSSYIAEEILNLSEQKKTGVFTVKENEQVEIPFNIKIPLNTPLTFSDSETWIRKEIDYEINSIFYYWWTCLSRKLIIIKPHDYQLAVMDALKHLGFGIENIKVYGSDSGVLKYIQVFKYNICSGIFKGYIDEIKVCLNFKETKLIVQFYIYKTLKETKGLLGRKTISVRDVTLIIDDDNVNNATDLIKHIINKNAV